jgi:hypothetical protein
VTVTRAELVRAARAQLWRDGEASAYLLDPGQAEWVQAFRAGDGAAVWMIGRQRGKSYAALTLACEECARRPDVIVRYAALTGKSARAIVLPTLVEVLRDCPPDVRPEVREIDGVVRWPNGSTLTWAGTDNEQFDRLRGPRAHLVLLDESAFYSDLERVESALLPQLTTTRGKALYLSTPPESVAHPFVARYRAAQAAGRARHATIEDNPRLGPEGVARIARIEAARLGLTDEQLRTSTGWRREYLAELVTEESRAAMPAWNERLHAAAVGEWERPAFWDGYQAHDPGITGDPHASLFAWHDPARNELVIEDELELRSAATTIRAWADSIKATEARLYGAHSWDGTIIGASDWAREFGGLPEYCQTAISEKAPRQPYLRVADNAQGLCRDLSSDYGLACFPTPKHAKAIEVDRCNTLLAHGRIRIHRRCTRLIEQLYSTVWNRSRSEWERTDKDHGDLVDCLTYLTRNVRWHRDCRPPPTGDVFRAPEHLVPQQDKRGLSALRGVFRPGR